MSCYNPEYLGNLFEVYGYEGWPDLAESDSGTDIDEYEEQEDDSI